MGWIIVIGLLLFFSGSGSLFCFSFLKEAETVGPWIATGISVMAMCVVVSYIKIKEIWSIKTALCVMGCFGLIQLIIIGTIKTPYYWKGDDEWVLRLCSGFFSQPLFCLVSYGIARMIEGNVDGKTFEIIRKIKAILEKQIDALNEINKELVAVSTEYKRADRLLNLLGIISDSSLEKTYIDTRNAKDKELISKINKILLDNRIALSIQGKTTSVIKQEVEKMIKEKRSVLTEVSSNKYTRKDYGTLKSRLKTINN